jgi:hypothetical protein
VQFPLTLISRLIGAISEGLVLAVMRIEVRTAFSGEEGLEFASVPASFSCGQTHAVTRPSKTASQPARRLFVRRVGFLYVVPEPALMIDETSAPAVTKLK